MKDLDSRIVNKLSAIDDSTLWMNEARFGVQHLNQAMSSLQSGAKVLEIGSGTGILLCHFSLQYPNLKIEGIEPMGPGFYKFEKYIKALKDLQNTNFKNEKYETYRPNEKFDLIYLINVFEHLDSWRDFLSYAKSMLTKNGRCIILCPNYGLPYESHFGLPIIINKKITFFIFKKKIKHFEEKHNCHGLWDSLNFVKYSEIKKHVKKINLDINFQTDILTNLFDRLDYDVEFRKRQGKLVYVVDFLKVIGFTKLLKNKIFWSIYPYLKLEIKNKDQTAN